MLTKASYNLYQHKRTYRLVMVMGIHISFLILSLVFIFYQGGSQADYDLFSMETYHFHGLILFWRSPQSTEFTFLGKKTPTNMILFWWGSAFFVLHWNERLFWKYQTNGYWHCTCKKLNTKEETKKDMKWRYR